MSIKYNNVPLVNEPNNKELKLVGNDEVFISPIFKTKDYDKFVLIISNRILRPGKTKMIEDAISKHDLRNENEIKVRLLDEDDDPIYNGKLAILDGQHRFMTFMKNEKSIWYRFTSMNKDDIGRFASTQTPWSLGDSLHCYKEQGFHDYKVLDFYYKKYHYPISTLISVLSAQNSRAMLDEFRNGTFKMTQKQSFVAELLEKIYEYKDVNDRVYRHKTFLQVYVDLLTHPEFNHRRMVRKSVSNPNEFYFCSKKIDYIRMLETLFNKNRTGFVRFI